MRISHVTALFVAELEQRILASDDTDFALMLGQWLARFLTANFCAVYQLKDIEEHLARRIGDIEVLLSGEIEDCVHVASEVYAYGGHSRLMRNLLSASEKAARCVVLTRPADPVGAAGILDVQTENIGICRAPSESSRVVELVAMLLKYRTIVLHIHPDDVIAAVAVALVKRLQPGRLVCFINHSDHTFSAAIGHADFVFEVSGYGWSLRAARGTVHSSTYLGIPLRAQEKASDMPVSGRILTGGSAYKYRPSGSRSLPGLLMSLLDRNSAVHVVAIGPKASDAWWWRLKSRFPSKFKRYARIPHQDYVRQLSDCSVYVDSYPVTGGTGFTEALIAGADVAGIRGGPNGYGVADALRSSNAAGFVDDVERLLRRDPAALAAQAKVRARARELHAIEAVHARFTAAIATGDLVPLPAELACDDYDFDFRTEWAKRGSPVCVGFAGRRELALLPALLGCTLKTLGSTAFAITLVAKASVGTAREMSLSWRYK